METPMGWRPLHRGWYWLGLYPLVFILAIAGLSTVGRIVYGFFADHVFPSRNVIVICAIPIAIALWNIAFSTWAQHRAGGIPVDHDPRDTRDRMRGLRSLCWLILLLSWVSVPTVVMSSVFAWKEMDVLRIERETHLEEWSGWAQGKNAQWVEEAYPDPNLESGKSIQKLEKNDRGIFRITVRLDLSDRPPVGFHRVRVQEAILKLRDSAVGLKLMEPAEATYPPTDSIVFRLESPPLSNPSQFAVLLIKTEEEEKVGTGGGGGIGRRYENLNLGKAVQVP